MLSLFSTRLIIEALGESDYGLYYIVGGVVALLGFITNALVLTTQRFVSYYFGKSETNQVRKIFANSLFIHVAFAIFIMIILLACRNFLIYEWLNIPEGRHDTAAMVYVITVFILMVTILIAPFKALYIARENILYISIIEVCDGVLKFGIAMCVLFIDTDRLLVYSILMFGIQLANIIAYASYALCRYEECHLLIRPSEIDMQCISSLIGFAGWSTYSMGCIVFRTQGIQLMLNKFFGTVVNASYGIAIQIYGSVSFVASSVLNAMNPQIIKAEGNGNRHKMLHLAEMESKYSTMLLMLCVVPIIFELPDILYVWLRRLPQHSVLFCRFILCGFIFDQLTYGLNTANQALGHIRIYTILMYTPKLLVLVPIYFLLTSSGMLLHMMCAYLASEILVSIMRLPYIKKTCGLSIRHFIKTVVVPILPLLFVQCVFGAVSTTYLELNYRFMFTIPLSMALGIVAIWVFALSNKERAYAVRLLTQRI